MLNVRPMKAEDMLKVIEDGLIECGITVNDDVRKLAEERERQGQAFTGFLGDDIVGCAGIDMFWKGMGEVWAMFRNMEHGHSSIRVIRNGLDVLIGQNNLHRAQCHIRCDFPKAVKLVEFLGFEREGILKKYTHDRVDCYVYAITR